MFNLGTALIGATIGATVGGLAYVINNGPNNLTIGNFLIATGVGAAQGSLAGFTLGGSVIAGAVVGGAIGIGADYVGQKLTNPPGQPIDDYSLVVSGIAGALGGTGAAVFEAGGATVGVAARFAASIAAGVELGLRISARRAEAATLASSSPVLSGRKRR